MIPAPIEPHIGSVHLQFAQYFGDEGIKPYLYLLSKRMAEGHVCLDLAAIAPAELQELGFTISDQGLESELVGKEGELQPFIIHDQKLYLQRYFSYETDFIDNIKRLIALEADSRPTRIASLQKEKLLGGVLAQLFPINEGGIDWQLAACIVAYTSKLSIITGGPGTGKTTTLRKLLAMHLYKAKANGEKQPKILLAAPTGKAAARMQQSLAASDGLLEQVMGTDIAQDIKSLAPTTIHRMLGYIPNSTTFQHNEEYKLDADLIVIDECSMIDIALFSKLIGAIDLDRANVVLLGDRNQLASVDAGSLFGDLCESLDALNEYDALMAETINEYLAPSHHLSAVDARQHNPLFGHIVALQKSYRFSDEAGIGAFSKSVLQGDTDKVATYFDAAGDIVLAEDRASAPKKAGSWINTFAQMLMDDQDGYVPEQDIHSALEKINHSKILCAMRIGPNGSAAINMELADFIKKGKGGIYYENRLLMVLKNQKELNIYNGDVGIIRNTPYPLFFMQDPSDPAHTIQLAAGNIDEASDAYAMTIHKSQGSEFDHVLVLIPEAGEQELLSRELLYTAVTRAKKSVVITGSKEAILASVGRKVSRISGIKNRLRA